MSAYPTGSVWRRWDLHIHSPASALSNEFAGATDAERWARYFEKLKTITDVSVVAITDYFSIDGYRRVRDENLTNFDLILPNVELRMLPVTNAEVPINIHVLFSPDIVDELDSKFFSGLEYEYQKETFKCVRSDLVKLGRKYRNNKTLAEEAAYKEGVEQFKIKSIDDLKALFKKDAVLRENALVAVSNRSKDGASGIPHSSLASMREEIYRFADLIFSSSPKDREYFLGKGTDDEETVVRKYGSLKPCVHGSDAHDLDRICRPCARRFVPGHDCAKSPGDCEMRNCWIKADPTFDGLKQVTFEPDERVQVQDTDPTTAKSNYCIARVRIPKARIDEELGIGDVDVPTNTSLVAITGGKGTGKTALVDLIANCYMDRVNSTDPNSFVRRITVDGKPRVQTEIALKDGTIFKKRIDEDRFYEDSPIVYIAQGDLESHVENTKALEEHIDRLVFESPKVRDTKKQFDYETLRAEVEALAAKLPKKNGLIHDLEEKTASKLETELGTTLGQHKARLKDVSGRVAGIEKGKSKAKTTEAKRKQGELEKLRARKQELQELQEAIVTAVEWQDENLSAFNEEIAKINEAVSRLQLGVEPFPQLTYERSRDLKALQKAVGGELRKVVASIERFQAALQKTAEEFKLHTKLLDDKKRLEKSITETEAKIGILADAKKKLEAERKLRKEMFTELLEKKVALKRAYDDIITAFASNADEVLSDLTFSADLHFDEEAFYEGCQRLFDERSVTVRGTDARPSDFRAVLGAATDLMAKPDRRRIAPFVEGIETVLGKLQMKVRKAVTGKALCDHLFSDLWVVAPSVKYKKVNLGKLSLGQKATVLIKIYLAQGDTPIVIDSHDDHLDNEFIMDELVMALRKAKQHRQVLIVSNNGNVVVNSDAEQVVIASRAGDGGISYISGALENPTLRPKLLKVLEGGEAAFSKRQRKYRLH